MKRISCFLLVLVLMAGVSAQATGNAPASQFGFQGWPYRQKAPCKPGVSPVPDAMATARPAPETPIRPSATATPGVQPSSQPSARPTAAHTRVPSVSTGDYTTISSTVQEQKAWNLLNQDRSRYGLASLPLDSELSRLARLKSCDMRDNHYFAHTSPTYGSAAAMLTSFGYAFRGVGENIAHHATVEKAQAAFMSSSGHRTNILGSQWTKVGIGVCVDGNGFVYVTQLFAR